MQENYKFSAQKYDILHISCGGATVKTFCFALSASRRERPLPRRTLWRKTNRGLSLTGWFVGREAAVLPPRWRAGNLKSNF